MIKQTWTVEVTSDLGLGGVPEAIMNMIKDEWPGANPVIVVKETDYVNLNPTPDPMAHDPNCKCQRVCGGDQ